MDNRERQAAFKAAMRSKGFVAATEWVPSEHRELFRSVARALREGQAVSIDTDSAREKSNEPRTRPVNKSKFDTVEGRLCAEAKSEGMSVPELLLRNVAENMYWLNVMLARDLNGGTTTTVQTTAERQAELFSAWVSSFHSASGRNAVRTRKTDSSIEVSVKPFNAVPLSIELVVGANLPAVCS